MNEEFQAMTERDHDLMLVVFGLSGLQDQTTVRARFIEYVQRGCPELSVDWVESGRAQGGEVLEVASVHRHHGWLRVRGPEQAGSARLLVRCCVRLLALVLDQLTAGPRREGASGSAASDAPPGEASPRARWGENLRGAGEHTAKDFYRLLFEHSPLASVLLSAEGYRLLLVNQAMAELLAYRPQDLLKRTLFDLTQPDDMEEVVPLISRLLSGESKLCACEVRLQGGDGNWRRVRVRGRLVRGLETEGASVLAVLELV